jgi:hypothetical protein
LYPPSKTILVFCVTVPKKIEPRFLKIIKMRIFDNFIRRGLDRMPEKQETRT